MKCDRCYRGTYHHVQCHACRGRGEVLRARLGPLSVTLIPMWKTNQHAAWVGEDAQP